MLLVGGLAALLVGVLALARGVAREAGAQRAADLAALAGARAMYAADQLTAAWVVSACSAAGR